MGVCLANSTVSICATILTLRILAVYSAYLEGLDESPEEDSDGVALPQELNEPGCTKQLQETHIKRVDRLQEKEVGV